MSKRGKMVALGCAVVVACTLVFVAGTASGTTGGGASVDCARMGSLTASLEWMIKAHNETDDPQHRQNMARSIAHVLGDDYDADPASVSIYSVCDDSEAYEALRAEALKIAEKPPPIRSTTLQSTTTRSELQTASPPKVVACSATDVLEGWHPSEIIERCP